MKYGPYSDSELPYGNYRCPSWDPMPEGKKNVVVLGCSHTYGVGHNNNTHWVAHLSKHNTKRLRYWNLGQPGASGDKVVRILYGSQKVIFPRIVIVCWPFWSRRERLGDQTKDLVSYDSILKSEDKHTDKNNFLKNVFLVEKFAEQNQCKTFHCFAQDSYHKQIYRSSYGDPQDPTAQLPDLNVLGTYTIKNCWPHWDKFEQRQQYKEPNLANDGEHFGVNHHKRFAELFLEKFKNKLN